MTQDIRPQDIAIASYDYELPEERIAKYPLEERSQSRLLIWRGGDITERHFYDLPSELPDPCPPGLRQGLRGAHRDLLP